MERTDYFIVNLVYFIILGIFGTTFIYFVEVRKVLILLIIENRLQSKITFVDSLFTTVSSLCVTGITVIPVAKLTLPSRILILILVQLGGIVMTAILPVFIRRGNLRKIAIKAEEVSP